jgi:RNA polymerase sigma factor (sigma-70 family)
MSRSGSTAFEALFEAHAEDLFGFLVYRTGDRHLAEDLVADTFERVLRSRARFDPRRGSGKNWVYSIALNLVRDHARRQTVETRVLERVGAQDWRQADDGALGSVEDRDALSRALATLGEDEREAIALRFGADLKLREVARVLGEGESAIEKRISRALKKLRNEL